MGQLALHTDVRIAAFHCDAPARCGAVADEWRVVANDEAAECGSETLIGRWVIDARTRPWSRRSLQALRCGTWAAGFCVPGFRVRASVRRAAADGSRFPPFDPVREAGLLNESACAGQTTSDELIAGGFVDRR
jgi:hypothetical protein